MQTIRQRFVCLNRASNHVFGHAKCIVKRETLHAQLNPQRKIRLWIADHDTKMQQAAKRPNCPKYDWLCDFTKCIILSRKISRLSLSNFQNSQFAFKTVCLNYVAANETMTFWPLNCLTYRQDPQSLQSILLVPTMTVILLAGILFGSCPKIIFCFRMRTEIENG